MKKSIKRIISFALMLSLLVGMMAGFNVFAAETPEVEIVSNNVYYSDTLNLMYAVRTADENVVVNIYDADGELVETIDDYTTQNVKGESVKVFISEIGVPAQDIDTVFYAQAETSNGAKSTMQRFSVLEYLYTRLTNPDVTDESTEAQKAEWAKKETMYKSLLAFADAADIVINETAADKSIANYAYVTVTNGTVDGTYATAMVMAGTALDALTTTYTPASGKVLAWEIVEADLNGDSNTSVQKADVLAAGEYAVEAGKVYTITATGLSAEKPVEQLLATFELGTATSDGSSGVSPYKETDGDYTLTITSSGGKMYLGYGSNESGLKFGSSSAKGDGSFTVASNVTKVVIYACTYVGSSKTDSTTITVNGKDYALTAEYQAITIEQPSENTEWTVSIEAKNKSSNRFYIHQVEYIGYAQ